MAKQKRSYAIAVAVFMLIAWLSSWSVVWGGGNSQTVPTRTFTPVPTTPTPPTSTSQPTKPPRQPTDTPVPATWTSVPPTMTSAPAIRQSPSPTGSGTPVVLQTTTSAPTLAGITATRSVQPVPTLAGTDTYSMSQPVAGTMTSTPAPSTPVAPLAATLTSPAAGSLLGSGGMTCLAALAAVAVIVVLVVLRRRGMND